MHLCFGIFCHLFGKVGNRLTWADLAMFTLIEPEKKNNIEVLQHFFANSFVVKENHFFTILINYCSADGFMPLFGELDWEGG